MSVNIQDFSPGSYMWRLVRGYNERRNAIGLKYRAYARSQWLDVDDISIATVSRGANIQHVNFWNEIISIPHRNEIVMGDGDSVLDSFFAYYDDAAKVFIPLTVSVNPIHQGDIIKASLLESISGMLSKMDLVVYSPVKYTRRTVSIDTINYPLSDTTEVVSAPFGFGAECGAEYGIYAGSDFYTSSVSSCRFDLYAPEATTTSRMFGYNPWSLSSDITLSGYQARLIATITEDGQYDSANYFSDAFLPSYQYWLSLNAIPSDSYYNVNDWAAAILKINPYYRFNFTTPP